LTVLAPNAGRNNFKKALKMKRILFNIFYFILVFIFVFVLFVGVTQATGCCPYGFSVKDSVWLTSCRLERYIDEDKNLTEDQKNMRKLVCKKERELLDIQKPCDGVYP
jgi:hypothetical protein